MSRKFLTLASLGTILSILLVGCVPPKASEPIAISSVRPVPEGIKTVDMTVPRSKLLGALEGTGSTNQLRVIPVAIGSAQVAVAPEYKLFNVRPDGVGGLLGLQERDILVAANDYVIKYPGQFILYLSALRNEKTAQIEIRRGERPYLFRYTFVD